VEPSGRYHECIQRANSIIRLKKAKNIRDHQDETIDIVKYPDTLPGFSPRHPDLTVTLSRRSRPIHAFLPSGQAASSPEEIVLKTIKGIVFAGSMVFAISAAAQETPVEPATGQQATQADVVVGATPEREALIEQCNNHKFETMIEIDPVKKRSTRIKLCSNPGANDADWVKTLEAAIAELDGRRMAPSAKEELIALLRIEIAKYAKATPAISTPYAIGQAAGETPLTMPPERFETSTLPSLDRPAKPAGAAAGSVAAPSEAAKPMAFTVKCLARGESGAGGTCDFLERNTTLVVRAVQGLEKGGTLRFKRRGEERGEVALNAMANGQSVRVKLPGELCKGVSGSKVEIELLPPGSRGSVGARVGPYGLRC
jgi:hypothetical protein